MPEFKSKSEVKKKLTQARQKLKVAREAKPLDQNKVNEAIKECINLQFVLDRWDALNS